MPISPNTGSIGGGQTVTITGVNLSNAISVKFGENSATIVANTPTSVTVVSPAGSGVVSITVETTGGISNFLSYFYILPPVVTGIASEQGPLAGGNSVTISGYNLSTSSSVLFGSNTATPTVVNDSTITVVVPAGSSPGNVDVYVTTNGGIGLPQKYAYIDAPTITSISPSSGSTSGGTVVTISGTDLTSTSSVTFDGSIAAFGVINSTTLFAIAPAGTAGAVDVVVTTAGGSATAAGGYTYISGPGI
jgi:hypothetical protein